MRRPHRIAIAGFGNVGQALAALIATRHPSTEGVVIAAVSDPRFGTVISDDHVDASSLLTAAASGGFGGLDGAVEDAGVPEMIEAVRAETFVELTYTDLATGEPANTHLRRALEAGMNVSTTNKGPIALRYRELNELAESKGVTLRFEGTVMSGTPVIEIAETVRHAVCRGVMGILNGTTNYIISRMETGTPYEAALAEAQSLGYAEADPTGDVEGLDTAGKLAILSHVLFDRALPLDLVSRVSLASVTVDEVMTAHKEGHPWRYVGRIVWVGDELEAVVSPQQLSLTNPLASIQGPTNALTLQTELLGEVTVVGPGAGRETTAFSVISDLRSIERARR